jgi:hypothetical protein
MHHSFRPNLEALESRHVPSVTMPSPAPPVAAPADSSGTLTHTQIHVMLHQNQIALKRTELNLSIDQHVLAALQKNPAPTPQQMQKIATLEADIPADQAEIQTFQMQVSVLSQLDDLTDQQRMLTRQVQVDTTLISALQKVGAPAAQEVAKLQGVVANDQATLQSIQPQIDALEQQVAGFTSPKGMGGMGGMGGMSGMGGMVGMGGM